MAQRQMFWSDFKMHWGAILIYNWEGMELISGIWSPALPKWEENGKKNGKKNGKNNTSTHHMVICFYYVERRRLCTFKQIEGWVTRPQPHVSHEAHDSGQPIIELSAKVWHNLTCTSQSKFQITSER